jgi:hypothetical protein
MDIESIEKEITETTEKLELMKRQLLSLIIERDTVFMKEHDVSHVKFKAVPLMNSNEEFIWTCFHKDETFTPVALVRVEDKMNQNLIKHWYFSINDVISSLEGLRIPIGEGDSRPDAFKSFEDRLQKLKESGELDEED